MEVYSWENDGTWYHDIYYNDILLYIILYLYMDNDIILDIHDIILCDIRILYSII